MALWLVTVTSRSHSDPHPLIQHPVWVGFSFFNPLPPLLTLLLPSTRSVTCVSTHWVLSILEPCVHALAAALTAQ